MALPEQQKPKPESLTRQASRGALWSLGSNVTVSAISFVGTAILARMLEPKDFGLMGMAVLVTGIVSLFGNFGLGAALVQKKDVTDEDLSTAFWANCAAGITLMVICILISPLAGFFFREDAVKWILICLSFNFVLSALCSVHNTLIFKHLQMKSLAIIIIGGRVLRVGAMLIAAFYGFRFWSIVIGIVVEKIFTTSAFFFLVAWRPTRIFSMDKFKEMFKFGRNLLGSGFLGYLNANMDFIVTGRVLGAELLGFYQMAYNLPHLITGYINESIGCVAFPVFCKVQDDNARLTKGLVKIIKYIALGTFPILMGLAFTARDFITVAYGEKWLLTVYPLQILCFAAALASVNTVVGALFNAKGRPGLNFKWNLVRLPASIIAILIGVYFGGIIGVALGMLGVEILSLAMVYQMFHMLGNNMKQYWKALVPAIASCCVMIAVLIIVNTLLPINEITAWFRLVVEFVIGSVAYVSTVFLVFKGTFRETKGFILQSMGIQIKD